MWLIKKLCHGSAWCHLIGILMSWIFVIIYLFCLLLCRQYICISLISPQGLENSQITPVHMNPYNITIKKNRSHGLRLNKIYMTWCQKWFVVECLLCNTESFDNLLQHVTRNANPGRKANTMIFYLYINFQPKNGIGGRDWDKWEMQSERW